jgi:hypothetical protein
VTFVVTPLHKVIALIRRRPSIAVGLLLLFLGWLVGLDSYSEVKSAPLPGQGTTIEVYVIGQRALSPDVYQLLLSQHVTQAEAERVGEVAPLRCRFHIEIIDSKGKRSSQDFKQLSHAAWTFNPPQLFYGSAEFQINSGLSRVIVYNNGCDAGQNFLSGEIRIVPVSERLMLIVYRQLLWLLAIFMLFWGVIAEFFVVMRSRRA